MKLQPLDIILSHSGKPASRLIQTARMSKVSHCRIMVSETEYIEAVFPRVRIQHIDQLTGHCEFYRDRRPFEQNEQVLMIVFLLSQVGRHYGWQSFVNQVLHYQLFTGKGPLCSVLAATAWRKHKRELVARRVDELVMPQDIKQSTELLEVL